MGKSLSQRDDRAILALLNRYIPASECILKTRLSDLFWQNHSGVSPNIARGRRVRIEQPKKESASQHDYRLAGETACECHHMVRAASSCS
jgi:hypothetical protein